MAKKVKVNVEEVAKQRAEIAQAFADKAIKNTYDFVMYFDVKDGNPNGDPDAFNVPRTDIETNVGLVTPVCLKYKVRRAVELFTQYAPEKYAPQTNRILVQEGTRLNTRFEEAYAALGFPVTQKKKSDSENMEDVETGENALRIPVANKYMCDNYFDVRTFGALMSTGDAPCGRTKGPVSFSYARSVEPVVIQDVKLTRCVRTKDDDKEGGMFANHQMIPYALYKVTGHIDGCLAQNSGFSEEDLALLVEAMKTMFAHDRSSVRGEMHVRKFVMFKHETLWGNADYDKLFDLVQAKRNAAVEVAREFKDYTITIDETGIPAGVTHEVIV